MRFKYIIEQVNNLMYQRAKYVDFVPKKNQSNYISGP